MIRAMSHKREDQIPHRQMVCDEVRHRDQTCRARDLVPAVACSIDHGEVHEIIPRSAWKDGYLVASNALLLCKQHHRWVDLHPEDAAEVGLHGYSWERPRAHWDGCEETETRTYGDVTYCALCGVEVGS